MSSIILTITKIMARDHKKIYPLAGISRFPHKSQRISTVPPHKLIEIAPIKPSPFLTTSSPLNTSRNIEIEIPMKIPPSIFG